MKKLVLMLVALVMIIASLFVSSGQAHAGSNGGKVYDEYGSAVGVDCSLSTHFHRDHTLHQRYSGKPWISNHWSNCSDADGFKADYNNRCFHFVSLFPTNLHLNGWYRINAGTAIKVPGLSSSYVYAAKECNGRNWKWAGNHFRRI